jgi:7-cyano-7-deazaguanine synthase
MKYNKEMATKNKAIVLVSGGMDSLVSACLACRDSEEIYFLHICYSQRTQYRELESYKKIVNHFQPVDAKIVNVDFLKDIGGSSLIDTTMPILPHHASPPLRVPNTYVPFRNGIFISIATAWAEVIEASQIYIGAVESDGSGYPDCRKDFFYAMERAVNHGIDEVAYPLDTRPYINIVTPIIDLTKADIVKLGVKLDAPFVYTWSCYQSDTTPCGVCDSCIIRANAFDIAGVADPVLEKK